MVPPFLVKQILIGIANILPKHKLVPQKDLAEAAFRDLKNRELVCFFFFFLSFFFWGWGGGVREWIFLRSFQ